MNHRYHMVLNKEMKKYLYKISNVLNKNISKTVIYIYKIMSPILKKHYYNFKCNIGEYKRIKADTNLKITIPLKDYKYFKQIHNNIHTFSTALILRWLIEEFIIGIEKYGFEEFINIMKKYEKIYLSKFYKQKSWNIGYMAGHMSSYIPRVKLTYSNEYDLTAFEFL